MKILEVIDSFYPSVDGPINVVVNIAKILNKNGLANVELLVPAHPKNVEIEGIKIHRCASLAAPEGNRMATPLMDSKVKNIIKNSGYDIIHVHSPFGLGKFAINCAKKCGIPTILTMHTKYKSDFERILKSKSLQNFMMSYIMRGVNSADYLLSVSNGAAKTVREYGYKGKNITIIRNGTDMKPCENNEEIQQRLEKKYHLKNNFVFLFVGRIVENKNIQFSLEVLRKIKLMGFTKFKFVIVGSGDYSSELKQMAKEYNLSSNVVFAGRVMDREVLAQIYKNANLFMFPSTFDTCGIVAIEAAAHKLPSAMLEGSCAAEKTINGVNGIALPEDTTIWANEIIKLCKNPKALKEMGEDAFKTIYVQWDKVVLEYYDFYEKVLKEYVPKQKTKKSSSKKSTKAKLKNEKKKKIERAKNINRIKKPIKKAQLAKEKKIIKRAVKIQKVKKEQIKASKRKNKSVSKTKTNKNNQKKQKINKT